MKVTSQYVNCYMLWASLAQLVNTNHQDAVITVHRYSLTAWSRVLLEKLTGFAANQEIPHILWNPKVHYRTHNCPPPVIIIIIIVIIITYLLTCSMEQSPS